MACLWALDGWKRDPVDSDCLRHSISLFGAWDALGMRLCGVWLSAFSFFFSYVTTMLDEVTGRA
jgi:hypothetical protein